MSLHWDLAEIVERLKAIEKILSNYSAAASTDQERNRELKARQQTVRVELAFDEATKREQKTEADRQHGTQDSIRWAAWAAFSAAVIYAGIAAYQGCEMHRATILSQQTLESSEDSARFDQRAWIRVTVPQWKLVAGIPARVGVKIENRGKSAAKNIYGYFVANFLDPYELPDFRYTRGHPRAVMKGGLMDVGDSGIRQIPVMPKFVPNPDAEIKSFVPDIVDVINFKTGNKWLSVHGQIWYDDIFGVHHWLTFCYVSQAEGPPDARFDNCIVGHNDRDDNREYPNTSQPFVPPPEGEPQQLSR